MSNCFFHCRVSRKYNVCKQSNTYCTENAWTCKVYKKKPYKRNTTHRLSTFIDFDAHDGVREWHLRHCSALRCRPALSGPMFSAPRDVLRRSYDRWCEWVGYITRCLSTQTRFCWVCALHYRTTQLDIKHADDSIAPDRQTTSSWQMASLQNDTDVHTAYRQKLSGYTAHTCCVVEPAPC